MRNSLLLNLVMTTSRKDFKMRLDNLREGNLSKASSHDGWMEPPDPEVVCYWISVTMRSSLGKRLLPPYCPVSRASWEHLVGQCVIKDAGIDGLALIQSNRARFMSLKRLALQAIPASRGLSQTTLT